jgi:hypothetical protein
VALPLPVRLATPDVPAAADDVASAAGVVALAAGVVALVADRDAPPAHHVRAVGDLQREADVLLDEEHADAGGRRDLAQDGEQAADDDRGEPEAHLVDDQQPGPA